MPIKCPVAPLEFSFLADSFFHERQVRDRVELTFVTPLDAAFTKPVASEHLAGLLAAEAHRARERLRDGRGRRRGRQADQLRRAGDPVRPPRHDPAPRWGGLRRALARVSETTSASSRPIERTLQSVAKPNVFAIGDATNLPTSKAGSVTHFEGDVLTRNVRRFLAGEELDAYVRRPRQLLHRDRLPQGAADRLQLRDRAAARAGSRPRSAPYRCSRSRG